MPSKTNEQALESAIERFLTGTCIEEIKEVDSFQGKVGDRLDGYGLGIGYFIGKPQDFNVQFAIDENRFWHFLEATQEEELLKIKKAIRLEIKNS